MTEATGSTLLTHAAGLHARPTLKLTMLAKTFAAKIEIAAKPEGPWIDAKSVVRVMAMKVPKGSTLHLRATGDKAEQAVTSLIALVDRDFDEGAESEKAANA
jgi:phosphocarrier protein HPr